MPSIAAGRLLGIEAAGLLHRATSTIQIYRKGVLEGLMPVLLPAFAAKLHLGQALKDSYLRVLAYFSAVSSHFSVVLALLRSEERGVGIGCGSTHNIRIWPNFYK